MPRVRLSDSVRLESRENLKVHFLALKNYRNPLGHAREIDVIEQKQGEAAIIWFRRALSAPIDATAILDAEQEASDMRQAEAILK